MKYISLLALLAVTLSTAACNKAESPSEVQKDVAVSTEKAASETTEARATAANKINDKVQDLGKSEQGVATAVREGAYEVAIAQADGEHKIAIQKCEALSGAQQSACKDRADADYKLAKETATRTKPSSP